MMRRLTTLLLGAAALAASGAAASAADLYGKGGSLKDGYAPVEAASPASWYLRGQVGFGWHHAPGMRETDCNPCVGTYDLHGTRIDSAWSAGLGVGRYLGRNFRVDVTWDHRFEADAAGRTGLAPGGVPTIVGWRSFGLRSDVVLANAYYDFDMGRFRPYIGIGIGASHNTTSEGDVTAWCGCTGTIAEGKQWSLAGALMTGFSMQVRDRMHVDAGYRYLYLGDAQTGAITGSGANGGLVSAGTQISDISAHEVRVGLRWDIR